MLSDREPVVSSQPSVQTYYGSLESRIGYRIFLGGTRHFGWYPIGQYWPFPINGALRAMEDHLLHSLQLSRGAEVLDAGCGVGHVAIHLAQQGLRVEGIDVVEHHVDKAHRNVARADVGAAVHVQKMDYHHLDGFAGGSFDGVYTMETFVHATRPEQALAGFLRVLKPGGSIALYEYDHKDLDLAPRDIKTSMEQINHFAAMPANARFDEGVLPRMLEAAGFVDVKVEDLSHNIRPMVRLFFVVAYLPYLLVQLFGLQAWFVNTVAGVQSYRGRNEWRYIAVTAKKPSDATSGMGGARARKNHR